MRESPLYKQTTGPARVGFGFRVPGRCPEVSETKIDEDPRVGQVVHAIGVFGVSPSNMIFSAWACPKPDTRRPVRAVAPPCPVTHAHLAWAWHARSAWRSGICGPVAPGFAAFDRQARVQRSSRRKMTVRGLNPAEPSAPLRLPAARLHKLAIAPPRSAHPLQAIREAPPA
ncbi:hypothetical protein GCM10023334_114200 [Nonomuraea thailandensis]